MFYARRLKQCTRFILAACLSATLLAPSAHAQRVYPYIIEDLGSIPLPDVPNNSSAAYGINSKGDVVMELFLKPDAHIGIYKDGIGIVDVGTPGHTNNGLSPLGINDAGQVAITLNPEFLPHAYVYDPKQGFLDGQLDTAYGINRFGNIIGTGHYPNGAGAAFLNFFIGGPVNLDEPFSHQDPRIYQLLVPRAISDDNVVAGTGYHRFNPYDYAHYMGFIWDSGEVQDLGSLGGDTTIPYGVNTKHQVVGTSSIADNVTYHAFLWQNTVMTDLGTLPNTTQSYASAINTNGEIVGVASGQYRVALFHCYPQGGMQAFEDLIDPATNWYFNAVYSNVTGINDRGQICGSAAHIINGGIILRAFRMTPRSALVTDVSSQVTLQRGGFRLDRASGHFVQTVTLRNTGNSAIAGPLSLVVDGLSSNATLVNKAGSTNFLLPAGSPYAVVNPAPPLAPGATISLTLEFTDPTLTAITYSTRVLAGNGLR